MLRCGDQLWMSRENFDMLNLLERMKRSNTRRDGSEEKAEKDGVGPAHIGHNITALKTRGSVSFDFTTTAYA